MDTINREPKPIAENPIVLDFSPCKTLGEIHITLKEKLGLPEYYGENWDALWDSLSDRLSEDREFYIEIHGYTTLGKELSDLSREMIDIFYEISQKCTNVSFRFIS